MKADYFRMISPSNFATFWNFPLAKHKIHWIYRLIPETTKNTQNEHDWPTKNVLCNSQFCSYFTLQQIKKPPTSFFFSKHPFQIIILTSLNFIHIFFRYLTTNQTSGKNPTIPFPRLKIWTILKTIKKLLHNTLVYNLKSFQKCFILYKSPDCFLLWQVYLVCQQL